MSRGSVISALLGLQGWRVREEGVTIEEDAVVVGIERRPGRGFRCSRCGERSLVYYDELKARRVRDFPVWGRRCFLEFKPNTAHLRFFNHVPYFDPAR